MYFSILGKKLRCQGTLYHLNLDEESGNETHGDDSAKLLAGLGSSGNDGRLSPVASRRLRASAHRRRNNHNGSGGLRARGGSRGRNNHNGGGSGLGPGRRSLGGGRDGVSRNSGGLSPSRRSLSGSRDSVSRNSGGNRSQSGGGNGNGADEGGSWDGHSGDGRATSRAVGDSRSTADDGLHLSLGDGAGGPGVRSSGLAVTRVNVMPLVVAVVITAVHGDVVRRVPDIGAALRRTVPGAIILGLDGDAERKIDFEVEADLGVDVDQVANTDVEAEAERRASLMGRSNGDNGGGSDDSRLHFDG